MSELGSFLRRMRVSRGLTQEQLAEKAALSVQAVGALERGDRRHPHARTRDQLAAALDLTEAQRATLAALAARRRPPGPGAGAAHQLPADAPAFVGREEQVSAAVAALTAADRVPVVSVSGPGGVGKTTFAVHVAHLVASRFPDGQLFVDLGGPHPLGIADALRAALRGLAVRDGLPQATGELAALLRSELAGRRVLLVLDDAVDADQVVPLLPGAPGCAVLVTGRPALSALEHGVRLGLAEFSDDEALELLARVVGRERVAAEPAPSAALVRHCDRLPLAVRIAAARLRARPDWPIAHLAARVADERRRLDELEIGGTGVRATLAESFDHLARGRGATDRAAAGSYPLLSAFAAPDVDVTVAARLLDRGEQDTERILERLAELNLLAAGGPGWYRQFDLLRTVGAERVVDRAAPIGRLLDLYTAVGWRAVALVNPDSPRLRWAVDPPPLEFPSAAAVFDWLYARRAHLVQVITDAGPEVAPERVCAAALSCMDFFRSKALWPAWIETCGAALAVAARGGDPLQIALLHGDMAVALAELAQSGSGDFAGVRSHAAASVAGVERSDGGPLLATVLNNQCYALGLAGELDAAVRAGERSIAVSAATGSRMLQALTTVTVGRLLGLRGDPAGEEQRYRAAVRIAEELGVTHVRAYVWHQLGTVRQRAHALDAAVAAFGRSAAAWRSLGEWAGEEHALAALGETQLALGRREEAAATFASALALAVKAGLAGEQRRLRACLGRTGDV
jgi:transcriptional regulator with XRE-family HTH domain/tetratricopeptide (TPR) repeat protein